MPRISLVGLIIISVVAHAEPPAAEPVDDTPSQVHEHQARIVATSPSVQKPIVHFETMDLSLYEFLNKKNQSLFRVKLEGSQALDNGTL